jgi:hypothetical protein
MGESIAEGTFHNVVVNHFCLFGQGNLAERVPLSTLLAAVLLKEPG